MIIWSLKKLKKNYVLIKYDIVLQKWPIFRNKNISLANVTGMPKSCSDQKKVVKIQLDENKYSESYSFTYFFGWSELGQRDRI